MINEQIAKQIEACYIRIEHLEAQIESENMKITELNDIANGV